MCLKAAAHYCTRIKFRVLNFCGLTERKVCKYTKFRGKFFHGIISRQVNSCVQGSWL